MSRIQNAFAKGKAFISFLTAGDPTMELTEKYIIAMAEAGSDLIEIGIPFSDPMAEGKVIEAASGRALAAGATTDTVFEMVRRVRKKTDVALVFLTYMNPVFAYGIERFFKTCAESGIDGIIIPDLPYEEQGEIAGAAAEYGIDIIMLVAPTSDERIQMLTKSAQGFIYLVSSLGVTGVRKEIKTDLSAIVADIRKVTKTPIAIGFGISTEQQARDMANVSDGVIVGSAIVKLIDEYKEDAVGHIAEYVARMKKAAQGNG